MPTTNIYDIHSLTHVSYSHLQKTYQPSVPAQCAAGGGYGTHSDDATRDDAPNDTKCSTQAGTRFSNAKGRCLKTPARRLLKGGGIRATHRSRPSSRRSRCAPPWNGRKFAAPRTGTSMLADTIVHVEKALLQGPDRPSGNRRTTLPRRFAARLVAKDALCAIQGRGRAAAFMCG